MANKKNKKNTDGPTMNGNPITTSGSAQNVPQNLQNANVPSSNANQHNNNPASSNGTVTPASTATNATTVPSGQQSNQSQNQQHHQKPTSTSSSQQTNSSKQPLKKTQQGEVEKISNSGGGSQVNQGGNASFRSSANKDQKTKEKEKEKSYQSRQGNQANNHHHNPNHFAGGGGGGNPQNHRKKDNKNRDHSNQSHRGGAFSNNYTNHNQQSHGHSADTGKSARFPSNSSLSSTGTTPTITVAPTPTPTSPSTTPVVQTPSKVSPAAAAAVSPVITHESKTVQTDDVVVEGKEIPQIAKKDEDLCPYKNTKIKEMDTVIAFQEHDEWNKVELMCELISYLSPSDLRLLSNCIEGLTRPYVMQMKPIEKTANGVDPLGGFPPFICAPVPVLPPTFSPASSESVICNQRNMVNNLFSNQQHPPGIPQPLMPTVVFPVDGSVQHPSSSTSSTPLNPPTPKETGSGAKSTSSTPIDISNQPDGQQQDSESGSNKGIGGSVTADLSVSKTTPELETNPNPAPNLVQSNSASAKQTGPQTPEESEKFLSDVKDIASYLYLLISVCASTNRRSAAKLSDYVSNVLLREKSQIFERIPNELDKIEVLEEIGKTVVALIHHPAVTLDDKIKYIDIRDSLRTEHENLFRVYYSPEKVAERKRQASILEGGVGDLDDGEGSDDGDNEDVERRFDVNEPFYPSSGHQQPKPSSAPGTFFITRFIGRQIEKNDNLISIEIHWSDGDRTFTQRSREQIKGLQHRLLDEFGQQRSEKYTHHGMNSSFSSFDEDHKKLSTSTSTMETTFAPSGDRIVPRLPREATPAQHVQYINELSDLPARMMLSTVMCEEFNGTRARTDDEANELSDGLIFSRWKNPRAKCPQSFYNRDESGNINPQPYPKTIHPFLHSNIPQTQSQILLPSCSNCGGQHLMKNCEKATLLERKALAEHKMRYEAEGGPMSAAMSASTQAPGGMVPVYAQMHPQMHHPVFIDNQAMMNANHFTHHQHQQMIQSNMYLNGQYRPNGQYVESPMTMFYSPPPQVVSNCGTSSGNNGNNGNNGGGVNQNSNFS